MRIAYLGPQGTYSEEAALVYGGQDSKTLPADTIADALQIVIAKRADIAIVPIENSTEGSVLQTLDLLSKTTLKIRGEVMLPIHHQLLSRADNRADIELVYSHAQSLAQCREWLNANLPGVPVTPVVSNAHAAMLAADNPRAAAIASRRASQIYKLRILAKDIEDQDQNTTRFVALSASDARRTGADKTSMVCSVPNRAGSLYELLGILARRNINMTKLESRPLRNGKWDYMFYIDVDGHRTDTNIADALQDITAMATFVNVLGSYPKGA